MQLLDGMEEDSRLNLTPSGERRERSYLKNQIILNGSQNKVDNGLSSNVPSNSSPLDGASHVCADNVGYHPRPHPSVHPSNSSDPQNRTQSFPAETYMAQQTDIQCGKRKASEYENNDQGYLNTNIRNVGP
jgi:hypothetical protein